MDVDGHAKVTASLAGEPPEDAGKGADTPMETPMDLHTGEPSSPCLPSAILCKSLGCVGSVWVEKQKMLVVGVIASWRACHRCAGHGMQGYATLH